MKIATWNVNGVRARSAQLLEWLAAEKPDIVCLQEIKASLDQLTFELRDIDGYWSYWHGEKGYSGVAMLVRESTFPERPAFHHPHFDFEHRIVTARLPDVTVASIYVPNGGKDFPAKMRFLEAMDAFAAEYQASKLPLIMCGDFNVARSDMDVHPKERRLNGIGQRPEERALIERILSRGLVDVHRVFEPDNPDLFTWWAPWRNMKERNIGWRLDYQFASTALAAKATSCRVQREVGTSDHGPVVAVFDLASQSPSLLF